MFRNKRLFYLALLFFIIVMVLSFPFPHIHPYGESIFTIFNIPIVSKDGLQYVGVATIMLLFAGLFLLRRSLKEYQLRFTLLALVLSLVLPQITANLIPKTIGKGIYGIAYEKEASECSFTMRDENTLHGKCELLFENFNENEVQFWVELNYQYPPEDDTMLEMVKRGPFLVTLPARTTERVKIEADINITEMNSSVATGTWSYVDIIVKSGEGFRRL